MSLLQSISAWAKRIKGDVVALWFVGGHPRTPWPTKALGLFVVAYALSPIDLIPDFIPVLGYLDDVVLLPALIWLALRLVPAEVLSECRLQAGEWMLRMGAKPRSYAGMAIVLAVWVGAGIALWRWWS